MIIIVLLFVTLHLERLESLIQVFGCKVTYFLENNDYLDYRLIELIYRKAEKSTKIPMETLKTHKCYLRVTYLWVIFCIFVPLIIYNKV